MKFGDALDLINDMMAGLEREVNVLANTDHVLYPIGQIVGLLKARDLIKSIAITLDEED